LDGTVLVVGGFQFPAERQPMAVGRYDPAANTWRVVGARLPSEGDSALLLGDGRVLVLGGRTEEDAQSWGPERRDQTALLYDPRNESWSSVRIPIAAPSLGLVLKDARVLIVGFDGTAAIWEPQGGSFTAVASLGVSSASGLRGALLADGTVL